MATFNLFDKIQMNSGVFAQFFQLIEAVVKAVSRSGAVCFVVWKTNHMILAWAQKLNYC